MRFGSVCSGIEAASVAWHPLGWRAAWLAEIEPFPSAVLAHHYPDVPNLGDMTHLPEAIVMGQVEAPDVFCGGTPCQAFSVAGLRKSLDDARGNLSLTFCEIANAIDISRAHDNLEPCIVFWENVPGVLNTKDNAFGCFLAGLAGEDDALVAPGGKWSDAGCVFGPQRAVAWRILDAQYFGLAQRRRRVFVVASARDGFDPVQVLFEWEGDRRDFAPSREAGKATAGRPVSSLDASFGRLRGCSGQDVNHGHSHLIAFGGNNQAGPIDVATARNACASASGRMDFESETFLVQPVAHAFDGRQSDVIQYGDMTGPLDTDGHTVAIPIISDADRADSSAQTPSPDAEGRIRLRDPGLGIGDDGDPMFTLQATKPHAVAIRTANTSANGHGISPELAHTLDQAQGQAVAFDTTQITSPANYSNPKLGDPCHPLATGAHAPAVAFDLRGREGGSQFEGPHDTANIRAASGGSSRSYVAAMQVRRLTPVECERLQGFPDHYTAIPWRNKPADQCPDGPRYKALGNSWAVPCVRWIGWRIAAQVYGELA